MEIKKAITFWITKTEVLQILKNNVDARGYTVTEIALTADGECSGIAEDSSYASPVPEKEFTPEKFHQLSTREITNEIEKLSDYPTISGIATRTYGCLCAGKIKNGLDLCNISDGITQIKKFRNWGPRCTFYLEAIMKKYGATFKE